MPSLRTRTLALACALALTHSLPSLAALAPGAAAEIISLEGAGDQRAASSSAWQSARIAQALATGDYVRTREAARMALVFADQTQLRLHHNTVLQIKALASAGQGTTTLHLEVGRAWTQTRRPNTSPLELQTPAATAAIRGTDWDISVAPDGRTQLTVLSGTVELSNAQGSISVGPNEAAIAEVGKAPVKLHLAQPRERVQWVNALQADPLPHLRAAPPPDGLLPVVDALAQHKPQAARQALAQTGPGVPAAWHATMQAAIALQTSDLASAHTALTHAQEKADAPLAAWLMLSDLQLMQGESAAAAQTLAHAQARWPQNPALLAQTARAHMLAERLDAARATLAGAPATGSVELALVRGQLARREGDASATLAAYTAATQNAPEDARGWLGLGSAHTEREDTAPARQNLQQALTLDPHLAQAQGERGTLETFGNDFTAAQAAFDAALQDNPADYVALTGQGLLHLKQGQPEAALDAFLRAGVMEPRYARAKTWTAVAYYQLSRRQDAIATLHQAAALDDKDPVPHMLLAQIYTDLFQPGDAVAAARAGVVRMPNLKSLNQLANDQKGSANLGSALAFFGMEDWALELAQQSFYPYWGGSHLFLADRYTDEFAKNSALFKGYLTDPMAFGASQRFGSLLQQPGSHGAVGWTFDRMDYRMNAPSATFNGMDNSRIPIAWYVKAQTVHASDYPIAVGVHNIAPFNDGTGRWQIRANALTLGLGAQPSERLNLFAYANAFNADFRGNNYFASTLDVSQPRGVWGLSYRWGPTAQTWLKIGRSLDSQRIANYPTLFSEPPTYGILGLAAQLNKRFNDLQLHHTVDTSAATRLSATFEHVTEKQTNLSGGLGLVDITLPDGSIFSDDMRYQGVNDIDRRYSALSLAMQHRYSPALRVDGALGWQRIRHRTTGQTQVDFAQLPVSSTDQAARHDTEHAFTPRLGLVLQAAPGQTLRLAYQDWMRPLSTSTLADVETAGIPVQSGLLQAGGRHKRLVLQWSQEWGPSTHIGLRADHLRLQNPQGAGIDMRTPNMPFLEELRSVQLVNLSGMDLLEDQPSYEQGRLQVLGASINHMFSRQWSGYAKAFYQSSKSSYSTNSGRVDGLQLPYIPRHTVALGATWASSARWYLSTRLVYRSERFADQGNLSRLAPGWSLDGIVFWESTDKRWIVGFAALDLFKANQETRYVFDARYRF